MRVPGRMHMDEAREHKFIVDDYVNPPIAYKGSRFNPDVLCECFTSLETRLIRSSAFEALKASDDVDEQRLVSEIVRYEILGREALKVVDRPRVRGTRGVV